MPGAFTIFTAVEKRVEAERALEIVLGEQAFKGGYNLLFEGGEDMAVEELCLI